MADSYHDVVHHAHAFEHRFFVVVWNGGFPMLMNPKYFRGGKAHGQVITECPCFLEELDVATMQDIITSTDEDFFHEG